MWPTLARRPAPVAQLRKVTLSQSCCASVSLVTPLGNAGSPGSSSWPRKGEPQPGQDRPGPLKPKSEESWERGRDMEGHGDRASEKGGREKRREEMSEHSRTAPPTRPDWLQGRSLPTPPIPLPPPPFSIVHNLREKKSLSVQLI